MELSRKHFLRQLAASGLATVAAAPLLGAFSALAQQPAAPAPAPGTAQPEEIDGEKVLRAVPVTKAEAAASGGARFVNSGPGFGRRIAITFDDGPNPKTTPKVLALLKERGLQATFFMIGQNVAHAPEMAKEVALAGHEIGNHSLTHPQLSRMPEDKVVYEIQHTQDLIVGATGVTPVWFRPPYGAYRKDQGVLASERGLGVMFWSVDPRDWSHPGVDKVVNTVLTETRPGNVILLHDIHQSTVDAVPRILDGLLERGFEFTSVSGFLGSPYGGPPGTVPPGVTAVPAPVPIVPGTEQVRPAQPIGQGQGTAAAG